MKDLLREALKEIIRDVVREELNTQQTPSDYREAKSMTAEQLAAKIGVNSNTIRRWESGAVDNLNHRKVSIHMRQAALALGVTIDAYRAAVRRAMEQRGAA